MDMGTYKCYSGDKLMPWGKGTVVKGAKGLVFLGGRTAWLEGYDPKSPDFPRPGTVVQGATAQWQYVLERIKEDLEELGKSLDNIVKLTLYVKGPLSEGVARSPNNRLDVMDKFFRKTAPVCAAIKTRHRRN